MSTPSTRTIYYVWGKNVRYFVRTRSKVQTFLLRIFSRIFPSFSNHFKLFVAHELYFHFARRSLQKQAFFPHFYSLLNSSKATEALLCGIFTPRTTFISVSYFSEHSKAKIVTKKMKIRLIYARKFSSNTCGSGYSSKMIKFQSILSKCLLLLNSWLCQIANALNMHLTL